MARPKKTKAWTSEQKLQPGPHFIPTRQELEVLNLILDYVHSEKLGLKGIELHRKIKVALEDNPVHHADKD